MSKKRRNLVNDMKYHYTYRITNIKEVMYYYGVHSCDCLPKEDIGIKYWSSTKRDGFIEHQKQNPEQYKYKVIKIFNTRVEAVEHEIFLHKKFDVKLHQKFYNDSNQTSTGFDTSGILHTKEAKDKMSKNSSGALNPMFGKPKSDKTKEKLRIANLGKTHTEETKAIISATHLGKTKTLEHREAISRGKKGVKLKTSICPHCGKEGAIANMNRYHFNNCKQKEKLNG